MTWLITGASGLLGPYLVDAASGTYQCYTDKIDLDDEDGICHAINHIKPNVVIHAAAYTDVDWCEGNPIKAFQVNHAGTVKIRKWLKRSTKLVYISTDMVYPDVPGPHKEEEASHFHPLNTYGLSKRLGEIAAKKHPNALVLRTNFFGPSQTPGRRSFSDWVLDSDDEQEFYDDVLFSPLHIRTLADLVVELVERGLTGVFNAGSRGGSTKHAFAEAVTRKVRKASKYPTDGVTPRPHDMRMDVSRLECRIGRRMPFLSEEIAKLGGASLPKWFTS